MRFLRSVAVLSLFASTIPGGLTSELIARTGTDVDVCANINVELEIPSTLLHGKSIKLGIIKACLCVSAVSSFCSSNPLTIAATLLVGRSKVLSIITSLINKNSGKQSCRYPDHAVPACKSGNPCFFTCKDGLIASPPGDRPTKCVCPAGKVECNGKCVKGPCPSGHHKRDLSYWGREAKCAHGLAVCGVLGRNARAWECVDTMQDLESCGGCTVPLFTDSINAEGVDCTALPGVADVSCIKGGCVVHRCMPGYVVSADHSSCVYSEDHDPEILAAQYGLEHIPL